MKKLIAMGAIAVAACAGAEETSLWGALFAKDDGSDAVTAAAAKADSGILKLTKQINELKAKIDDAKNLPQKKLDDLKSQYEELKAKLKAKLDEYKAKQAQKTEEEKKKAEEEKAKIDQVKKDGKDWVDSFKSLFK